MQSVFFISAGEFYFSGLGEGFGDGSSPRFFSFGGSELDSVGESLESVESGSGWRRFRVGLPGSFSSMSLITPALTLESRKRCALTR